jgi:hypothetical protein
MTRLSIFSASLAVCLFFLAIDGAHAAPAPADNCQSRECRYFRHYFDLANGPGHDAAFAETFDAVRTEWEKISRLSPNVSLGAMLALVVYESGARLDFFNTRDAENSFRKRLAPNRPFVDQPLAYYSYQFGIVPIHTSLLRPCMKGTKSLRDRFDEIVRQEGFALTLEDLDSVRARWIAACSESHLGHVEQPGPQAVDYYILQAHSAPFNIPVNAVSSRQSTLAPGALKAFPFFSARVTAPLFFATLAREAKNLHDDGDAIKAFGGGDAAYARQDRQESILRSWQQFH